MSNTQWVPITIRADAIEELIRSQRDEHFTDTSRDYPHPSKPKEYEDPFKLSINMFEDRDSAQDYKCIICQDIAIKPIVHRNSNCKAIFCKECYDAFITHNITAACPFRCNQPFIPIPLPHFGERSISKFCKLKIKCRRCNHKTSVRKLKHHIENKHFIRIAIKDVSI